MSNTIKRNLIAIFSAAILIFIDRITKMTAVTYLSGGSDVIILKDIFVLHYLENRGAAFGMLQNKQILFIILTFVVIIILFKVFMDIPFEKRYIPLVIIFIFLFSGACGNLIDRILNGYVVDFFYFSLIDFPVFNVADIYVSCSVTVLIILMIFLYKEDDFNRIFHQESKNL